MILFVFFLTLWSSTLAISDNFKGCHKVRYSSQVYYISQYINDEQCLTICKSKFYRYSAIHENQSCYCDNFLGELINSTVPCKIICDQCEIERSLTDIYFTGNLVPGPPDNVQMTNITDRSIHISWEKPKSYTNINGYRIKATVNHTYANFILNNPEWIYTNNTFRTKILIWPATTYNITICALSSEGTGAVYFKLIETEVGEPENLPENPEIMKRHEKTMEVKLTETSNNNGPITSYLIIVLNNNYQQFFEENSLTSFNEAKKNGITYYITAELSPEEIHKNFVIGDGSYNKGYYNAPLESNLSYSVMAGIVSKLKGKTKRAFSILHDNQIKDKTINQRKELNGDSPAVIVGLSVAIGLLTFLLIVGIIGFVILKTHITNRRHTLSENQELTVRGPMIEVENNGYIPEEEEDRKTNYYQNLKQKLKTIPYNQLNIEPTNLLGIGRFGRLQYATIYENNALLPVAAYTIFDQKLSFEDKKTMLKDLDILIKTEKHENIIKLIGACENSQMIVVILEYISMKLKDFLLSSRNSVLGKFSNVSENKILQVAIGVCEGMAYLESKKIIHKQLCARNIVMTNGSIPKISGFGLAQYCNRNSLLNYTRWTACEIFNGYFHNVKSDVWSFGCLLWEICTLGGTPYNNLPNNEIKSQVLKGSRLPQLQYFSDEFYQLMLNCWQVDMDERPSFAALVESLETLKENSSIPCLSFQVYPTFQYEPFYPDLEVDLKLDS